VSVTIKIADNREYRRIFKTGQRADADAAVDGRDGQRDGREEQAQRSPRARLFNDKDAAAANPPINLPLISSSSSLGMEASSRRMPVVHYSKVHSTQIPPVVVGFSAIPMLQYSTCLKLKAKSCH